MDHQPQPTPIQPGAPGRTEGRRIRAAAIAVAVVAIVAAACSGDRSEDPADLSGTTVTLLTHDSFYVSPETFEAFTAETGITVEHLASGDAGALVAQACLTAGEPLGDVLFGIDNTFLQRGLDCGMFEPYASPGLAAVPDRFELDPDHRVTPIDFGDVCLNYWIDAFDGSPPPPSSLDDLIDPTYEGMVVVQSPETSSPGLAFLLATIARYGDGWEDYWSALRANGVAVTAGWEDAYYGEFTAGGGDRPIVVSYASSPPAEVIYADPPVDEPPTGVVTASCYRQIEFAGVLAGSGNPGGAQALIDFMLTPTFQNDVPLNMFVFPVADTATLPDVFVAHAEIAEDPFILEPAEVEAQRNDWTDRWVEIVLR
ncbi:MAG: thiamine ABC transporter substrate-binding protein [Acidimicrobiaceae bacterium]|nr:thiamine ABC transporter substrate-binding protein [Acidimicrobiaceae bacterium]MYI36934.1 thiamine ABC transporter substrate-binding protein [Acidimicrobiaceae bacterium]